MSRHDFEVLEDPAALAAAASREYLETAREAARERGRFVVVLSGGSTPRDLHNLLAAEPLCSRLPWSRTVVLFGDERHVGPADDRSNYRMAHETLLSHVRVPHDQVHRMHGELEDVSVAAAAYENTLREVFAGANLPRFDLVLLGVGEDGHTASLFPGTAALDESERWVVANHVPRLSTWRITLTLPALCAARRILFLVSGEKKARVVAEAFGGLSHATPHPCERVVPVDGTRTVLLDRGAGRLLAGGA